MTMTMTISQDQIVEITGTVWASFLGVTPRELEPSESSTAEGGHTATATVHISGSWNGSVILSCSTTLARRSAAAMFQIGADDLDDEEIADAFGELANMIGGNLKCLLPEPSMLSLPTVSQGAAHVVTIPGARLLQHVELECDGDRLHIAVWSRREDRRLDQHAAPEGMTR
jgi:chemotaxis protein CheX